MNSFLFSVVFILETYYACTKVLQIFLIVVCLYKIQLCSQRSNAYRVKMVILIILFYYKILMHLIPLRPIYLHSSWNLIAQVQNNFSLRWDFRINIYICTRLSLTSARRDTGERCFYIYWNTMYYFFMRKVGTLIQWEVMQQIFHVNCYIAHLYMIWHGCLLFITITERLCQHLRMGSETTTASVPLFFPLPHTPFFWECADA